MLPALVDWAGRALSLFCTIVLVWLGLTVLLTAERRSPITLLAGLSLLGGALFFAGHTAVVARPPDTFDAELAFWWRASWLLFAIAPYLWYLVMCWYSGRLAAGRALLLPGLLAVLGLAILGLLLRAPAPSYDELSTGALAGPPGIRGLPLVVPAFGAYAVLCVGLALRALQRPAAPARFLGAAARARARPWLIATSLALLAIGLAVGLAAGWYLHVAAPAQRALADPAVFLLLREFDLLVLALVAAALVLLGRAIVAYEVFTGKALPRGGLRRLWRAGLVLAAGYGALVALSLALPLDPVVPLLLATLLVAAFYGLLGWRFYAERERDIARLRPFVAGPRLYDRLLQAAPPADGELALAALCDDVLGARQAALVPLGSLAALVDRPLTHPPHGAAPLPAVGGLADALASPATLAVPLAPERWAGAVWAVALWSERGLIGALLLGPKHDGGLYTQEELEIARATAERLLDTRASAALAARLMALQRARLAETSVADRRTRALLHDEVLPRLHTALLALSAVPAPAGAAADPASLTDAQALLVEAHGQVADLLRALPAGPPPTVASLGPLGALQRLLATELGADFDAVAWEVPAAAVAAASALPALTAEVVYGAAREVVRNAARHGRGGQPGRLLHLTVTATQADAGLIVDIADDGVGVDGTGAGTAAAPHGGSGQGLALHGTLLAVIGGALTVEAGAAGGTHVRLTVPLASC